MNRTSKLASIFQEARLYSVFTSNLNVVAKLVVMVILVQLTFWFVVQERQFCF